MILLSFIYALIFLVSHPRVATADGIVKLRHFKTEPDFKAPLVKITDKPENPALLAPGLIFYGPKNGKDTRAPLILDNDGEVVWYGSNALGKGSQRGQDLHVCDFKGEIGKHICFSDLIYKPFPAGPHHVLDNQYNEVDYSEKIEDFQWPNVHENNDVKGGESFLQAVFVPKVVDLTAYGLSNESWLTDGCFQEVSSRTHEEIFRWCASDHFPLWVTYIYTKAPKGKEQVNDTLPYGGTGEKKHPWDFIHLNSVDKNEEGDYLISARHWDAVVKIAGPKAKEVHGIEPGEVIWTLGGRFSDFEMTANARFFRQHHVRFVETTATETKISIFNNADDGAHKADIPIADGRIVALNNKTMKATLVKKFPHPKGYRCASQGSMSVYKNGNVMVGWGYCNSPGFTEFSADGSVLLSGDVPNGPSYRARKYNWTAYPTWKPKLLAYSPDCHTGGVTAYVSWNGATEVTTWRVYTGSSQQGPWTQVGDTQKAGFETQIKVSDRLRSYVFAEALDHTGKVLGDVWAKTWIPDHSKLPSDVVCDKGGCNGPKKSFHYKPELSCTETCNRSMLLLLFGALVFITVIELCDQLTQGFFRIGVELGESASNTKYEALKRVSSHHQHHNHAYYHGEH